MPIIFIAAGTVAIEATVLRNSALLAGAGFSPSCSESIETVAAVGKLMPSTTMAFMIPDTGSRYTSAAVITGSRISFTMLV